MNEQEIKQWADEVAVYLHMLAFDAVQPRDRPLPPLLDPDTTVLHDRQHVYLCMCPICRGTA